MLWKRAFSAPLLNQLYLKLNFDEKQLRVNIYFEDIDQTVANGNSVTKATFSIYNKEKKFIGKNKIIR